MKKKSVELISILSLIFLALGVLLSLGFVYAFDRGEEVVGSNWLVTTEEYLDGTETKTRRLAYNSVVEAGGVTGYGKFILNATDVELKTEANEGFTLVGWNVTYNDKSNFLENVDNLPVVNYQVAEETGVTIKMTYQDSDSDGYFDKGSLIISNVFADMKIDPVFDYIYYKADVTDVFALSTNYKKEPININGVNVYYSSLETAGDVTTYKESFIEQDGKIYYSGDVIYKNGELYTAHEEFRDGTNKTQLVSVNRGAFRLNKKLNIELNIFTSNPNAEDYNSSSVNIDLQSVSVITNGVSQALNRSEEPVDTSYYNTADSFNRTNFVVARFNVLNAKNQINILKFNYHNLYIATITAKVDNVLANEEELNYVLGATKVSNYYSQINSTKYFAKNSAITGSATFTLVSDENIYNNVAGKDYKYYTFASLELTGNIDNTANYVNGRTIFYNKVIDDFGVVIHYSSIKYQIYFNAYLLKNGLLTEITDEDFAVASGIEKVRGTGFACDLTYAPENVGYKFYGFMLEGQEPTENESVNVEIDKDRPDAVEIYVIYELIDYSIYLTNYDSIYLKNSSFEYSFPINTLTANINGVNRVNMDSAALRGTDLSTNKTILLGTVNVGDVIKISTTANTGFEINGYYILNKDNSYSADEFEFVIDKAFILNLLSAEGNVEVFVEEDYHYYTLTYYTNLTMDTTLGESVYMANITASSDSDNTEIKFNPTYWDAENKYANRIEITGLRLYDTVKLNATGLTSGERTYVFDMFTVTGKSELPRTFDESTNTYTYNATITRDVEIFVVYSQSVAKLVLSLNDDGAGAFDDTDFSQFVTIIQDGNELTIKDNNKVNNLKPDDFTVQLKANYNFGYKFESYTFTDPGRFKIDQNVSALGYPYSVTFKADDISQTEYLILNFSLVSYRASVYQFGYGYDAKGNLTNYNRTPLLTNGNAYINLNVKDEESKTLQFEMPTGAYVSKFKFVKDGAETEYSALNQDNTYASKYFKHEFTSQELQSLVEYGEDKGDVCDFVIYVNYELHTYNISVTYKFTNSKGRFDEYFEYPTPVLNYKFANENKTSEANYRGETTVFINVPYGVEATVSFDGLPDGFTSKSTWYQSNTVSSFVSGANFITLNKVVAEENLVYMVDYESYIIDIRIDGGYFNQGNPVVKVNGATSSTESTISMYDSLSIEANASRSSGFVFVNMIYFTPYRNADNFAEEYSNLYVYNFDTKQYEQNLDANYNPNTNYYIANIYDEDTIYKVDMFDVKNYAVVNRNITFIMVYDYLQVEIVNNTLNATGTTLAVGDLNITPEQYATYTVQKRVGAEWVDLAEDEKVTYKDSVRILVKLNSVAINENEENLYNLSKGLYLYSVAFNDTMFAYDNNENGEYVVNFNISDIINIIPDSGLLDLGYSYVIQNKTATITTNITTSSFYYKDSSTNFQMRSTPQNGFDGSMAESVLSTKLSYKMQFLGVSLFNYAFTSNSNYADYFEIKGATIYLADGSEIKPQDYAYYGIVLDYHTNGNLNSVIVRYVDDINIVLVVQPVIYYNGATKNDDGNYVFEAIFDCDENGNGVDQYLTVDNTNAGNIQAADIILDCLKDDSGEYDIRYINESGATTTPIDVGTYSVKLNFNANKEGYEWVSEIDLVYNVYFVIKPRTVYLSNENNFKYTKVYDGKDSISYSNVAEYLLVTDNANLSLKCSDVNTRFSFADMVCYITKTTNGTEVATKNASDAYYNLLIMGINLTSTNFNNNFVIGNNTLLIRDCIRISKKAINISGIVVGDKVWDGTNEVSSQALNSNTNWRITGVLDDDVTSHSVAVVYDNISFVYQNAEIGANKRVVMSVENALTGSASNNYFISVNNYTASIYPYSVSTYVEGYGEITVFNKRGREDSRYANLIPIGVKLDKLPDFVISVIYPDSNEYRSIYSYISSNLSNVIQFEVGYQFKFKVGNATTDLSNQLYVSLPTVDRLNSSLWLSGDKSGKLEFSEEGDHIVIDLSQIDGRLDAVIFTKNRVLLVWWQICLIVFAILLLILLIVLIYILVRRRKIRRNSYNDTI